MSFLTMGILLKSYLKNEIKKEQKVNKKQKKRSYRQKKANLFRFR